MLSTLQQLTHSIHQPPRLSTQHARFQATSVATLWSLIFGSIKCITYYIHSDVNYQFYAHFRTHFGAGDNMYTNIAIIVVAFFFSHPNVCSELKNNMQNEMCI